MTPTISADALFARIQATWDDARNGRALPRRQDIDAVKLDALLPYVGLIDVIHGDKIDLRYRLVGAQTTQSYGFNLTGHFHSQLTNPHSADQILRHVRQMRDHGHRSID